MSILKPMPPGTHSGVNTGDVTLGANTSLAFTLTGQSLAIQTSPEFIGNVVSSAGGFFADGVLAAVRGGAASGGVGVKLYTQNSYTSGKLVSIVNNATEKAYFDHAGGYAVDSSDSSGTPGDATISKPSGRSAIAIGTSSVVITNTLCTDNTKVFVSWRLIPYRASDYAVDDVSDWGVYAESAGGGKFTVALGGLALANYTFDWFIIQPL